MGMVEEGEKKMMSDASFFRMRARALSLLLIPAMHCSTRPTHQPKLSPQALFLWGGGGERRGCGGRRPKVSRRHIRRARFFLQTVSFLLSLSHTYQEHAKGRQQDGADVLDDEGGVDHGGGGG